MTTPHGQFDQVLRLHEFSTKIDSVFAFLNGNQVFAMEFSRTVSHNYYYLDAQTEYPILTSYTNENKQVLFTEYYRTKVPSTMDANEIKNQLNFKMYPNPSQNNITVEIGMEDTQLVLMDLSGKITYQTSLLAETQTISISALQPGMYIYSILSKDGTVLASDKLIKE